MLGQENQRVSICLSRNGTHTDTMAMARMVARRNRTAMRRAQISSSPVVFITHQVAPSSP
jgi:hypothetical protein